MSLQLSYRMRLFFLAGIIIAILGDTRSALAQGAQAVEVTRIASIGVLAGDSRIEFGGIAGVAADDRTDVLFVLDRLNHRLSAFRREGDFIAAAGGQGGGPGEFRYARAVAAEGSSVHVLDPGNARISTFEFQTDAFVIKSETRLPMAEGWDMCALDEHFFVLRYDPQRERLIHRIASSGEVIASFGRAFRNGDAVMAMYTDVGIIVCDPVSESIYVTATSTPIVRRYSATGELLWEAEVPGMTPPTITRTTTSIRFSRPPGRDHSDMTVSLAVLPAERLLVQFGETFPGMDGMGGDIIDVTSAVFDIRDGTVLGTFDHLPRIDFTSGQHAYSHTSDPFPGVIVYEWR